MVQGLVYSWRQKQALSLSLLAFSLPLILVLFVDFWQRWGWPIASEPQIMPFLLIFFAAAGYEARRARSASKQQHKTRVQRRRAFS